MPIRRRSRGKDTIVALATLLGSTLFSVSTARAEPILLATVVFGIGGAAEHSTPIYVTGGGFSLFFLEDKSACVGCQPYLQPGIYQDAFFDFTASNSQGWANFTNRLTDATNETFLWGECIYGDGIANGGGCGGGGTSEVKSFGRLISSPLLVESIDLVRLNIVSGSFSVSEFTYAIAGRGEWQIFGEPGPAFQGPYGKRYSAIVPEPATLTLMFLGLLVLGFSRHREAR